MIRFRRHRLNIRFVLIVSLLVVGILIRVGYAYLKQDLDINGVAIASKNTWDVHFVEGSIDSSTSNLSTCVNENQCSRVTTPATISQDGKSVNFGVIFHVIGDYYEFTVDVVNNGTIDAMLNEVVKDGLSQYSDYLDFTVTYADGMPITQYDELLKCGHTEKLRVRVTFVSAPDNDVSASLGVTVNYVQGDSNMRSRALNPETRIRSLNTIGESIADDDPDHNLRFIGANPNNYVWFNGQKWRIIGVFNGKLKIIQNPIGNYSWDTSRNTVNGGYGINQWGASGTYTGADLMKLLNPGYESNKDVKCNSTYSGTTCGTNTDSDYVEGLVNNSLYWNAGSGYCYNYANYKTTTCNFTNTGLKTDAARNMIDNATWYLGSNSGSFNIWDGRYNASFAYNFERGNLSGKQCSSGTSCTDTVDRNTCLTVHAGYVSDNSVSNWNNTYTDCKNNDWLLPSSWIWSLSPRAFSSISSNVFRVNTAGYVNDISAMAAGSVRPVVYLKSSIKFTTGDGSYATPFNLIDTE